MTDDNLKGALQLHGDTAVQAASVMSLASPDPRVALWWDHQGHQFLERPVAPPLRAWAAADPDSLVAILKAHGTAPAVWVGPASVEAMLDHADRRELVIMDMPTTARFRRLRALADQSVAFDPEPLRRHLKRLGVSAEDRALFQGLSFSQSSNSDDEKDRGAHTMGNRVEAKLAQADKVPEALTVEDVVYGGVSLVALEVEVEVYADLHRGKVELSVDADELAAVQLAARTTVACQLRDMLGAKAQVFLGQHGEPPPARHATCT